MKILLVDDNPIHRRLARAVLESEGQQVVTAVDGVEALEALAREPFDAIVSDVLMPRMDGYRLCREIRRQHHHRLMPFVFYTSSYSSPMDEKLAFDLGADKFLVKPATGEQLLAALTEVTTDPRYRQERRLEATPELEVQQEFSGRLVARLEAKNEELHERTRQMRTAQERLHHLLAHSPVVLYTLRITAEGMEPVVVSDNIERLLGVQPQATSSAWWYENLHPEDRQRVLAATSDGLARGESLSLEYRIRHIDGTYRWMQDHRRTICDAANRPVEVVGAWTDITERRQLEGQLRQAQKLESLGRLAGGVAHDFNNMLGVITGYCELLRDRLTDEHLQGYADEILKAGERAASLTRQLLAFSRRQILQPRILDLNRVVREVETMLRRLIGEDVELVTHLADNLPAIKADSGQLEQVLMNLAVNARDAMPQGGRLTLETEVRSVDFNDGEQEGAGEYVVLRVIDNGCGMSAEVKAHLFEPFYTTKALGHGTGLGLATVHGIVEQSGGRVRVASEVDAGTTFEIFLPRAEGMAAQVAAPLIIDEIPHGDETILVVEDEEALRELVRRVLVGCGYRVIPVGDGSSAIRAYDAETAAIDLLLTDVVLPDGSGALVARQLAERHPSLKVLFMTGYTDDAIVLRGALTQGADVLEKPFTPGSLARKVRDVLDRANGGS